MNKLLSPIIPLRKNFWVGLLTIVLLLAADYCLARAGGGGGGSYGRGAGYGGGLFTMILAFVLAPFFFLYSIYVSIKLVNRNKKVVALTNQLAKADKMWNYRKMVAAAEDAFFKVQHAWMERNQDLAKDVMSDRIYQKHKMQTDQFIKSGTKNILENINLAEINIISVADYLDNSEDTFSAYLKGSMIDYRIDLKTNAVTWGSSLKPESFEEIWTFIREGQKWKLDEIDQTVKMDDLNRAVAYSESVGQ